MRWKVPLAAMATLFVAAPLWAQDVVPGPHGNLKRAEPSAEPENGGTYASPAPHKLAPRTEDDYGPVLKHFVRASGTDDLMETQVQDNATLLIPENIALDKNIKVPLVHDVQNDDSYVAGNNPALDYERKYLNWGAITASQLQARQGHYFTITWANDGPPGDYVACFEYRQVKSKEIVRKLEQPMKHVSGSTRSYFAVVDKAYLAYGPVSAWRFTIRRGDTIVGQAKSFIW
jgi:hypothetical protein